MIRPKWMAAAERATARGTQLGFGAYLTAHTSARSVKLYIPSDRDQTRGGGKRGKVTLFSAASRKRMLEKIHLVERAAVLPEFVTLTFPDFFPDERQAKTFLTTLFKRWKRRWPKTSVVWRIELMDRKSGVNAGQVAPHFHLLVWGRFDASHAAKDWFEICGSSDYAHLRHGCDAETMQSWHGAVFYCAKYVAKVDENGFACQGRVWGVHNKAFLPVDRKPVRMALTRRAAFKVRRWLKKRSERRTGRRTQHIPFTLFTSQPFDWLRLASEDHL